MKTVCVPCGLFFRIKKNGYVFEEGLPIGPRAENPRCARPDCGEIQDQHPGYSSNPDPPGCDQFVHPPTRDQYAAWGPYKLWMGDLWSCPGCGTEIVLTMPTQNPIAEHYQTTYEEKTRTFPPQLRVNDC